MLFFLYLSKLIKYFLFQVKRLGSTLHKHLVIAPKAVCNGVDHLEHFYQDVMEQGGEGIILRDPKAPYQSGRSTSYLKHKVHILSLSLSLPSCFILRNSGMQKPRLYELLISINGNAKCMWAFILLLFLFIFFLF